MYPGHQPLPTNPALCTKCRVLLTAPSALLSVFTTGYQRLHIHLTPSFHQCPLCVGIHASPLFLTTLKKQHGEEEKVTKLCRERWTDGMRDVVDGIAREREAREGFRFLVVKVEGVHGEVENPFQKNDLRARDLEAASEIEGYFGQVRNIEIAVSWKGNEISRFEVIGSQENGCVDLRFQGRKWTAVVVGGGSVKTGIVRMVSGGGRWEEKGRGEEGVSWKGSDGADIVVKSLR